MVNLSDGYNISDRDILHFPYHKPLPDFHLYYSSKYYGMCGEVDIAHSLQLSFHRQPPRNSMRPEETEEITEKIEENSEGKDGRGSCKSELQRVCNIYFLIVHGAWMLTARAR